MSKELIVSNISQHIPLTPSEAAFLLSLLELKTVAKKQFLLRPGEICRFDNFILKGCVKVCYHDEKGTECIIKFAPENWWVVDLDSFLNSKPAFYYIQAIEETEVYQLSRSNYDLLYKSIPQFQKFSNERWQNGFIALQQRIMQNLSLTAEERYQHFIHKYPGLEQRIPQKLIASYLGITPEFLSMLRKKWATQFS
jgi:CRP-like cAMP-binding protein